MPHLNDIDINEDEIQQLGETLLDILLIDRTTRKNILWATEDYRELGESYNPHNAIQKSLIIKQNNQIIQPRITKTNSTKATRTKNKAEVFTPSWICNQQNNLVDEKWFERPNVFNRVIKEGWETIYDTIVFPNTHKHTWKDYVDLKRLEMTCGEAPYIVSRYDTVSGEKIELKDRIGILDRKLRVINENTTTHEEWVKWARRAVESVYGYEYQGDNLLIARENILFSYIDYYMYRFKKLPDKDELKQIAIIISWNIWQMDGLNYAIPFCETAEDNHQLSLFDFMDDCDDFAYIELSDPKGQLFSKIHDWRSKETIEYRNILKGRC